MEPHTFYKMFLHYNHLHWPLFSTSKLTFQEFSLIRMESTLESFSISVKKEEVKAIVKAFQQEYLISIERNEEIIKWLEEISREQEIGIVTNGTSFNAYKKVERIGLFNLFPNDRIVISEEVGFSKPNKQIFFHALDRFQATPEKTLFVGDNYYTDILGASSAGLQTAWINPNELEPFKEYKPNFTVKSVTDLQKKELLT